MAETPDTQGALVRIAGVLDGMASLADNALNTMELYGLDGESTVQVSATDSAVAEALAVNVAILAEDLTILGSWLKRLMSEQAGKAVPAERPRPPRQSAGEDAKPLVELAEPAELAAKNPADNAQGSNESGKTENPALASEVTGDAPSEDKREQTGFAAARAAVNTLFDSRSGSPAPAAAPQVPPVASRHAERVGELLGPQRAASIEAVRLKDTDETPSPNPSTNQDEKLPADDEPEGRNDEPPVIAAASAAPAAPDQAPTPKAVQTPPSPPPRPVSRPRAPTRPERARVIEQQPLLPPVPIEADAAMTPEEIAASTNMLSIICRQLEAAGGKMTYAMVVNRLYSVGVRLHPRLVQNLFHRLAARGYYQIASNRAVLGGQPAIVQINSALVNAVATNSASMVEDLLAPLSEDIAPPLSVTA